MNQRVKDKNAVSLFSLYRTVAFNLPTDEAENGTNDCPDKLIYIITN